MIKFLIIAFLLNFSLTFAAYHPQPVKHSQAETQFRAAYDAANSKEVRIQVCREFIEANLEDIPAGRFAVDMMKKDMDKSSLISYTKYLSILYQNSLAANYFYARVIDDTTVWEEKARWAMENFPNSAWTYLTAMAAEWHKSDPDMQTVLQHIKKAVDLDPARPEAYFFLGSAFATQKQYENAVEAYEAGLICDPNNAGLNSGKIDATLSLRESSGLHTPADEQAKVRLQEMVSADQTNRAQLDSVMKSYGNDAPQTKELMEKQTAITAENLLSLEQIMMDMQSWPLISKVGRQASTAAFLMIQHADDSTQQKYYPMMKHAAEDYELSPAEFSMLEDRILTHQNKPQIYGSQLRTNADGKPELFPIEDEQNVDIRRARVGLQPLRDYCRYFNIDYTPKR